MGLCEAIHASGCLPVFGTRVLGGVPLRAPAPDPGCGTARPRSCSPSSTASCRPPSPGVIGAYTPLIARALEVSVPTVKPRVLWRLVYLVPVVAGCDCSWRWRSGAQAASCSAGVRIPMAECGRMVPAQWTHSAVASTGGVDVLPRALVTDQLDLVQGVQSLGQGKARRSRPSTPPRRPPRTRTGPTHSGWTCTAPHGRKWCTRPVRSAP